MDHIKIKPAAKSLRAAAVEAVGHQIEFTIHPSLLPKQK
jgi:hypothetical protein